MRKKFFLFIIAAFMATSMWAYDFSAVVGSGQTLYFDITDSENHVCVVVAGNSTPTGDLVIPATVEHESITYTVSGIGDRAFRECSDLTSVTFPTAATFTHIGISKSMSFVFIDSYNFPSLVIPDNVTSLGGQAFRDTGIRNITFGSGVSALPKGLFGWCSYLTRVVLPNAVTAVGVDCFCSSAVKYVELGNAIADGFEASSLGQSIPDYAKTSIDTVVIHTVTPPTVNGSFYSDLLNRAILYVPVGSKAAYKAADGWKDFKYILEIGEKLPIYDITVQGGYSSLEQVSFTVDGLDYASNKNFTFKRAEGDEFTIQVNFGNPYYGIKKALYGETDVTDQFNAENTATLSVTADATLSFTYEQKTHPYDFAKTVPSGQTLYFKILDAGNHKVAICNQTGSRSLWGTIMDAYDYNTTVPSGDLVIPATITHDEVEYTIEEIDTLALHNSSITSLTLPEGLKAIRGGAFYHPANYNLGNNAELVIPGSCTIVEMRAFQGCNYVSLNPGGAQTLGKYAFSGCPLTEIKATDALQSIDANLVQSAALTKVELGANVDFVHMSAFSGCPNIQTVTMEATTPPEVSNEKGGYAPSEWYGFDPTEKTLYVPFSKDHSVLAAYQDATGWKLFGTIQEKSEKPTDIDQITNDELQKTHKLLRNGQLLIERDGKIINAIGVRVK